MPKAKVTVEKEEARGVKYSKEQALDEGRIIGPVAKYSPETMQKVEALAAATRKKKVEIVSEALDFYYEMQSLGGLWSIISTMTPEQLQAAWQLFRYFMKLARDIYVDMGKEFIEGTVAKYVAMLEGARREGYMAARQSFEAQLERKKEEKMARLMEKIDPLLDVLTDWMIDQMAKFMFAGKTKKPKFKVPVEVEGGGEEQHQVNVPVEVEA
ncbi:MAG: hypothetical protein ACXQTI_08510 [Candidatus Nezhaarchaeales archaeon]